MGYRLYLKNPQILANNILLFNVIFSFLFGGLREERSRCGDAPLFSIGQPPLLYTLVLVYLYAAGLQFQFRRFVVPCNQIKKRKAFSVPAAFAGLIFH